MKCSDADLQGELEHRTPKSRYKRTDKRAYVKQLTRIERRQTRIRRIKEKLYGVAQVEDVARSFDVHHHIGKSENLFRHIGTFLEENSNDPAVKVKLLYNLEDSHLIKNTGILP